VQDTVLVFVDLQTALCYNIQIANFKILGGKKKEALLPSCKGCDAEVLTGTQLFT
jgi:hypothetical protein